MKKLLLLLALGAAAAHAQTGHEGHAGHEAQAGAPAAAVEMSDGEIRKVDRGTGRLTIRHGELKNLGMAGMTMAFRAADPAMLEQVKPGDAGTGQARRPGALCRRQGGGDLHGGPAGDGRVIAVLPGDDASLAACHGCAAAPPDQAGRCNGIRSAAR